MQAASNPSADGQGTPLAGTHMTLMHEPHFTDEAGWRLRASKNRCRL